MNNEMLYSGLREASTDTDKRCYTLAGIGKRLFVRPLLTKSARHYLPFATRNLGRNRRLHYD